MTPVEVRSAVTLRAPPESVWRFFAETDRLNRAVGLPSIRFQAFDDPGKQGHYKARTRFLGLRFEYEEFPFDWIEGRYHEVLRRFNGGPLREMVNGIRLSPEDGGKATRLEAYSRFSPRGVWGAAVLRLLLLRSSTDSVVALARAFERSYASPGAPQPAPPPAASIHPAAFEERAGKLKASAAPPAAVERLLPYLRTASDLEVSRLRPFELADAWGLDRFDVLRAMLYAARAGLLDMTWNVLCPNCRAPSGELLSLAQLHASSHCATCKVDFGTDFSGSVEARFRVNPGVRAARQETYCIGGPANMPQIVCQWRLEPGETRRAAVPAAPGVLRARSFSVPGMAAVRARADGGAPAGLKAVLGEKGLTLDADAVRAGEIALEVSNPLPREGLFILERENWRETAATAAQVTSLQDFRDLFPDEAVAPGEEIGISTLAVLFTDLKGSTALYARVGDAPAFGYVMSHFRYLAGALSAHHGGLVKTMGDAIMASFASAEDAVAAALEMQARWDAFLSERGIPSDLLLKVGVHQGPVIAINNRGKLDYFGGTVNLASRLKDLSQGRDVVLSAAVRDDPGARGLLEERGLRCAGFSAALKGFDGEQALYRLPAIQP